MKYINLIIGVFCLVVNMAVCLLITSVSNKVLIITSAVIALTTLLNHISGRLSIKDAFKVSLPFFFTFMGLVGYVLSFFVDRCESLQDNLFFVGIVVCAAIQISTLIITTIVSKEEGAKK